MPIGKNARHLVDFSPSAEWRSQLSTPHRAHRQPQAVTCWRTPRDAKTTNLFVPQIPHPGFLPPLFSSKKAARPLSILSPASKKSTQVRPRETTNEKKWSTFHRNTTTFAEKYSTFCHLYSTFQEYPTIVKTDNPHCLPFSPSFPPPHSGEEEAFSPFLSISLSTTSLIQQEAEAPPGCFVPNFGMGKKSLRSTKAERRQALFFRNSPRRLRDTFQRLRLPKNPANPCSRRKSL